MLAYTLKRLAAAVPVMLIVAIITFMLMHIGSVDPASRIAGELATPEEVEKIRIAMGLDRPLLHQFVSWFGQVLSGDFGTSILNRMPVLDLVGQRIEPTLSIALFTIVFAVALAVPMGVLAAWNAGTWVDHLIMALAVIAFSMPVFLVGYLLIYQFSIELRLLPVQGYKPLAGGVGPYLRHLVLPVVSLGLVFLALIARMTRATMLEVLNQDYIRTARAKGLGNTRILVLHALKNAANPIVTTIGFGIAALIGGVVVTETVFAIPGIGRLTIDAVIRRDFPVIQGVILLFSAAYVLINLAIDLSYALFDPRIRY
ncbi:ABC transporter permease [Nitratireductor soli]|uniref:ABC transporter permease n=1 Tax=Nitratireductor soli TaxID=1670619 RepID=UPI00065E9ABB|nr:ABC transporter permease [Nitratireductor soli]